MLVGDSVYLIVKESPGNALIGFDLNRRTTEPIADKAALGGETLSHMGQPFGTSFGQITKVPH